MQKRFSVFLLCSLVAGGATLTSRPAKAQSTGPIPVRVKLGVLLPSQGTTRTATGSTHFNVEADVSIPSLGMGNTFVSAGYSQGSKNGIKLRSIPVTISKLFQPPNPASGVTGNVYFGVGAGAYFLKASGGGVSRSKTQIGGFGVVGYQFPHAFFVEAKYHLVGKVAGVTPSGLALMVGRHF